jgi:ADP-ribosylglycohydrolase
MDILRDRAMGCLAGGAVGDALGGPTEGWTPEQIAERYDGPVMGIVGPYFDNWREARPLAPFHNGDGRITDDTLMVLALVRVYGKVRDHLDAYAVAEHLVPELRDHISWIPELAVEAPTLQRLFLAEKWLVLRLHHAHIDPREAGVGNIVNCGAAMYMAPVGVLNAGNPGAAYAEAIELASAHQSSYGREAAGVFAAAVAEAMSPGATVDSVVATCLRLAKDGTAAAIEAVCSAAAGAGHWSEAWLALRSAVRPYDTVGEDFTAPGLGAHRPSRLHAIEELPIALGMLVLANGDYPEAVLGAVNYGRDSDSIANMAGAISGALGGVKAVPADWLAAVSDGSRLDVLAPGRLMADIAVEVFEKDQQRSAAHKSTFHDLIR